MTIQSVLKSVLAVSLLLALSGPAFATQYTYSFTFQGKRQTLKLDLAANLINHYQNKTHYWPTSLQAYPNQSKEDPGYEYLSDIAASIERQASNQGYTGWTSFSTPPPSYKA